MKNVRSTMASNDPMRGVLELTRKLNVNTELSVQPVHKLLPDIWQDVRHMQIK